MAKRNIQITRSCNFLIKWQNSMIMKYCSAAELLKKYCSIPKIVLVCLRVYFWILFPWLTGVKPVKLCKAFAAHMFLINSGPSNREKWWRVISPNPGPNMSLQHMDDGTDAKSMFFYILRFTDTQMHDSTIWNVSKWVDLFLEHKKKKRSNERNPAETEQKKNKRNAYKRKREKTNTETNIKRGAELRELWCQFSAAGIISPACSLVKEALMQTYTDSSELLKEGQKKVMCVSHCELVKTKPRSIRRILGRLLE